jgi:PHD/YefM family antitoxin component YafN of YafNO toxin-antitoxin module
MEIIPIKNLKNTGEITELCKKTDEPIFVTKNGYKSLVIMSMDVYKKTKLMSEIFDKLLEAENDISEKNILDGKKSLKELRESYGL